MTVNKLRTISLFEIGRMESYFSDMAKEGLCLTDINILFNVFNKSEPAEIEYRIEFGERVLKEEIRELYEGSGWNYTCSYRGIHVFQAPTAGAFVEIHTDPKEQSYTLNTICRRSIGVICIEMVLLPFIVALVVLQTMIGRTPFIYLLESNFLQLFNLLALLLMVYDIVINTKILFQYKKRLQMGFYINHHEPWRKRRASFYVINGCSVLIIFLVIVSLAFGIGNTVGLITGWSKSALTLSSKLPVVRLNDIEKLEAPVFRKEDSGYDERARSNVEVTYALLMNEKEVNEEFKQEDIPWEGDVYTPSLHTNYYKVYLPFTVQGVLSDVLHHAENYFVKWPDGRNVVEKLDCKGLDDVYYISSGSSENYFGLVVRKGNEILWMRYMGKKTRAEVIEASQALFD